MMDLSKRLLTLISGFLLCIASDALHAQDGPADPDAIDFSQKLTRILSSGDVGHPIDVIRNLGDLDVDGHSDVSFSGTIRRGGPWLFDPSQESGHNKLPVLTLDLNGDQKLDLVAEDGPYMFIYQGVSEEHFFDSLPTRLAMRSYLARTQVIGTADYDGDGGAELLVLFDPYLSSDLPSYFGLVSSIPSGTFPEVTYPMDSLEAPKFIYRQALGNLTQEGPSIVFVQKDNSSGGTVYRLGLVRYSSRLADAKVQWLSSSKTDGPDAKNIHVYDITGDGIDDLLVADGDSVFVYKGGSEFGNQALTKSNAFYIIRSPKWEGNTEWPGLAGFGGRMQSCGDITGDGIPYLMCSAGTGWPGEEAAFAFFYAGGKALDTKFDAHVKLGEGEIWYGDTLTVDQSGRTAYLLLHLKTGEQVAYLLHDGTDKIPHRVNPQMKVNHQKSSDIAIQYVDNKVILHLKTPLTEHQFVSIHDVLGRVVFSSSLDPYRGANEVRINSTQLAAGTYILFVTGSENSFTAKFSILN